MDIYCKNCGQKIKETEKLVEQDAIESGMSNDHIPLCKNGSGARAYGEAIGVYLSFAIDKMLEEKMLIIPGTKMKLANKTITNNIFNFLIISLVFLVFKTISFVKNH